MYNGTMKRGKIMTRDKAIEEVKNYENYPNGLSKECRDYIVKALEQVPSSLENPNLSENPISSITKNGISNRTIIYKAKESKDIQEDLEKLEKLNEPTTKKCTTCAYREIDGKPHEMCKSCVCGDRYRENSTTKNDLGVREFEEIVVEYPPEDLCTYPEYKGKPYFSIKYKEGNDYFIGYGTYNPKVFSRYLRDYFMPSVTPIRPKGHWICDGKGRSFADYHCSECGLKLALCGQDIKQRQDSGYSLFCGGCGADMREVEENDELKD